MKYFLILLFSFNVCYAQVKPKVEDMWIYNILHQYEVGIMHDSDTWIGGRTVYEVFFNDAWSREPQKGYKCYELTECHAWRPCDCAPVDSAHNAIIKRYREDKKFRDSIDNR